MKYLSSLLQPIITVSPTIRLKMKNQDGIVRQATVHQSMCPAMCRLYWHAPSEKLWGLIPRTERPFGDSIAQVADTICPQSL